MVFTKTGLQYALSKRKKWRTVGTSWMVKIKIPVSVAFYLKLKESGLWLAGAGKEWRGNRGGGRMLKKREEGGRKKPPPKKARDIFYQAEN